MVIREAKSSDKLDILKFCKNTFSWGDYIDDVWDYWLSEGNLFVLEKNIPIAICHAFFSPNQVWIEGIRISPNFRRQGFGSQLIKKAESLAIQKKISFSYMLIEAKNRPSIMMAEKLNYKIYQTWNFYYLLPQQNNRSDISFGNTIQENEFSHYVKSWRWLPLDKKTLDFLSSKNCIIYSEKEGKKTIAILEDSEHFLKTLIVTLFAGSTENNLDIISYLQNFGVEKKYERIQILTKETLLVHKNLEYKISFHLMKKLLS